MFLKVKNIKIDVPILNLSLFVIFFWFGILKPLGLSPAEELVIKTVDWMPFFEPLIWVKNNWRMRSIYRYIFLIQQNYKDLFGSVIFTNDWYFYSIIQATTCMLPTKSYTLCAYVRRSVYN